MKEKLFDLEELAEAIYDPEKEYQYYITCDVIIVQLKKAKEAEGLVRYFHLEKVFKYIRRLVLDEAHILMEHKSFRPASIMKISEVFGNGVHKLFLFARFLSCMSPGYVECLISRIGEFIVERPSAKISTILLCKIRLM